MSAAAPDRDALTVAMALAPGVYARNRLFSFFKDPRVKAARTRAGVLRGVVRQLGTKQVELESVCFGNAANGAVVLRYRIPALQYERTLELTSLEAACLRVLAARAKVVGLDPLPGDRALVDNALRRLAHGGGPRIELD